MSWRKSEEVGVVTALERYNVRMSRGEQTTKRRWWIPRFTIRTLAIFVTLVCAYLGTWDATKRFGMRTVDELAVNQANVAKESGWSGIPSNTRCPAPFIICLTQWWTQKTSKSYINVQSRRHFIWFFGTVIEIRHDPTEGTLVEPSKGSITIERSGGPTNSYPDD
jgi:hypothetical protein